MMNGNLVNLKNFIEITKKLDIIKYPINDKNEMAEANTAAFFYEGNGVNNIKDYIAVAISGIKTGKIITDLKNKLSSHIDTNMVTDSKADKVFYDKDITYPHTMG